MSKERYLSRYFDNNKNPKSSVKIQNHTLLLTICTNLVFKDDIRSFKKGLDAGR